jgi:hypothetical protein
MFGILLAHDTGELPGVGKFQTLVLATARRATIAAFAGAVAITASSAAGQAKTSGSAEAASPPSGHTASVTATTSAGAASHPMEEGHPPTGSGSVMVDNVEQCEPGKYWSYWKYTNMDFESIMACKR